MKSLLLSAAVSVFVLQSCQKELNEITISVQQCKIVKGYYYGGSGGPNDSADFIYNSSGKLIKWKSNDGYYDYYYTGNNITVRTFHDNPSGELWFIDSVHYDANNKITELTSYDYSLIFNTDSVHLKRIFQYQNNLLSHIIRVDYFDWGSGPQTDTQFTTMSWTPSGNIEKMIFTDAFNYPIDSIYYQYNADPNYFSLVHPHFFLFDPGFELHADLEPHLAYFYSKNNVNNFQIYGGFNYPISYGIDSINHVTSVSMGGFEYIKYKYQCELH